MKLKKSISIILSCAMAANLACSYIAQASTKEVTDVNTTPVTETTTEKNINSVVSKKGVETKVKETEVQHHNIDAVENKYSRKKLVDRFITKNGKYLPESKIRDLSSKLQKLSDEDIYKLSSISLDNPENIRLISIFFGSMGIDRMIIGKVGTGILKFLTGGGLGIWWLVDIFKIGKLTKEQNWKKLKEEISDI